MLGENCFADMRYWLDNFLKSNESKTEVLIFGFPLPGLVDQLGPWKINVQDHLRSTGVILDSSLLLLISAVVKIIIGPL